MEGHFGLSCFARIFKRPITLIVNRVNRVRNDGSSYNSSQCLPIEGLSDIKYYRPIYIYNYANCHFVPLVRRE